MFPEDVERRTGSTVDRKWSLSCCGVPVRGSVSGTRWTTALHGLLDRRLRRRQRRSTARHRDAPLHTGVTSDRVFKTDLRSIKFD